MKKLAVLVPLLSVLVFSSSPAHAALMGDGLDPSTVVTSGAPGAIATASVDGRWSSGSSGVAQLESQTPAEASDAVRIGSITKPMVATVIMQLVDSGQVELDASLHTYLPDVVPNDNQITVHNLLNHTSGLPDYAGKLYTNAEAFTSYATHPLTPQQLIAVALEGEPAQVAPGKWSYSNTNYVLLGLIVEHITGHPVSEELRSRVFLPAGMDHTIMRTDDPNISGPHMDGYVLQPGTEERPYNATNYTPTLAFSAGAVISTTADVDRFFHALFNGKLVSTRALEEMKTTVPSDQSDVRYGLGLIRYEVPAAPSGVLWGHDGSVAGFNSLGLTTDDGSKQVTVAANVYAVLVPDVITAEMKFATSTLVN